MSEARGEILRGLITLLAEADGYQEAGLELVNCVREINDVEDASTFCIGIPPQFS